MEVPEGPPFTNASILVVEDESIVALDILNLLESFGYRGPEWVATGEDAIEKAHNIRPDLVLMDISLAGRISGLEAAAIIRESLDIPVLYLTANSDRATIQKAQDTGPVGYVLKPFEKRELEVAVEMALYRSRLEKELAAALRQTEMERAKSEAIISGIGMGLSMMDPGFRVLYQNPVSQKMTGGDHTGKICYEAYRGRNRVCDNCTLVRSFETGSVVTMEHEYERDGRIIFLEITASPLRNAEGAITAGVELVRDITQRKKIEISLLESEERYRTLVEHTPTGIVIIGDGIIEFVNPAGVALFGADNKEMLVGRTFLDFIHPDGQKLVTEQLRANDRVRQGALERKLVRLDGLDLDVELIFTPFVAGEKNLVQVIVHNITERKQTEQLIRQMAYYDSLTGLPNRRLFDDHLHLTLALARRYGRQFAILFIDLDNFKHVNDRLGHIVGDELLKEVAMRLRDCCRRENETVARFGGDEFIILLPELQEVAQAQGLAARLFREFAREFQVGEHTLTTNLSIGVSIFPQDGDTAKILLMRADTALYRAKAEGRNTCRFYSDIRQGTPP